ncbi:MAG: 1-deoxy-D-xylulose-5-phosphate synthase N-terminal domain-containing protein [Alphaproteobacteria bacterium]
MPTARSAALKPIATDAGDAGPAPAGAVDPREVAVLEALRSKILWLSSWMIHNANHLRPNPDGVKVGGHQASSASVSTLMTALYLSVLKPEDRVAVKPHASPIFHSIQYLLGRQTRDKLENFRALGGAQSYPSRTKDIDDVDFSTGSVGLGVAITVFASLVQDYVRARRAENAAPAGRMVAIVGDAELDEGNVFEALLEGWKHDVRNLWWIIDYNRQSLDSVVNDRLFGRFDGLFRSMGWNVIVLKYGKRLEAAFAGPDGERLRDWIDECPNSLYSALVFKGGAAWRKELEKDLGDVTGIRAILDSHDDDALAVLMTNLAGHDMESVLEAFRSVTDDRPTCFLAYTIKGMGLPFAGHKDNHSGLMNPDQMDVFKRSMKIAEGQEWDAFAGLDMPEETLRAFLDAVPFRTEGPRRHMASVVPVDIVTPKGARMSTQEGFGKILNELGKSDNPLSQKVVTTSPDVTVSTNLGGWVNQRGIFSRSERQDVFREVQVVSAQRWGQSPRGQHFELGIAEHNLFLMLGAAGLSHSLYGERILPVGTLYDPFINRGLDALNYALYQDARFMVVATPSGVTLAPEGGAHQSINTPLVGIGLPGLSYFEPSHVDELAVIMRWGFAHMQAPDGGSLYLRLSTRPLEQPDRLLDDGIAEQIIEGAYWAVSPEEGADFALVYTGAMAPDALAAHRAILEDMPGAGLLAVTSPDRLYEGWMAEGAGSHAARLLGRLAADARLVSVIDGHPATLGWLGSVRGQRIRALGVTAFGQSGSVSDLHRINRIDAEGIVDATARLLLGR